MTQEHLQKVEGSAKSVDEMVKVILNDPNGGLAELDTYISTVRACFLGNQEVLMDDLNKILLQIPIYMYRVIDFYKDVEMRRGLAKEHAQYAKNEAILTATGTVADKAARAENQTAEDRITELAYVTALSNIKSKLDGALAILDSTKKVQQARLKEQALTGMAGSAAATF